MLGRRDLWADSEIKAYIANSRSYNDATENPDTAAALPFFRTSRQQTWLVATERNLYCILDDVRKLEPHINWSMPREEVMSKDEVTLDIKASVSAKGSNVMAFGPRHERWLYSKNLFGSTGPEDTVREFLQSKMTASGRRGP